MGTLSLSLVHLGNGPVNAELAAAIGQPVLPMLIKDGIAVVSGSTSPQELVKLAKQFDAVDVGVIVVDNAIEIDSGDKIATLRALRGIATTKKLFEVLRLAKTPPRRWIVTPFARPGLTVTVIATHGPDVVITHRAAGVEQAGRLAFPGTFVDPLESPQEAAVRAITETIGCEIPASYITTPLWVGQVDADRDNRDFIVDCVYVVRIADDLWETVNKTLKAVGDAQDVIIAPIAEVLDPELAPLMKEEFAFHHKNVLAEVWNKYVDQHLEADAGISRLALFERFGRRFGKIKVQKSAKPGAKGYREVQARVVENPDGEELVTIETRASGGKEKFPKGRMVLTESAGTPNEAVWGMDAEVFNLRWQPVAGKPGWYCPRPVPTDAVILPKAMVVKTKWGDLAGEPGSAMICYGPFDFAILAREKFETYEGCDEQSNRMWHQMRVIVEAGSKQETSIGDAPRPNAWVELNETVRIRVDQVGVSGDRMSVQTSGEISIAKRDGGVLEVVANETVKSTGEAISGTVTIVAGEHTAVVAITFGGKL